jgi:hypothetical protein
MVPVNEKLSSESLLQAKEMISLYYGDIARDLVVIDEDFCAYIVVQQFGT